MELPKAYNPREVEDAIYKKWEDSGFFNPDNLSGKRKNAFSIVLPPPNATGALHIGHSMTMAIEDLMIRYHRMKGDKTLWVPGTDHAAIATNALVEKLLVKEGKTKYDLGREKFVEKVKAYIADSQRIMIAQMRKMGSSLDWSREAYTWDEKRNRAVKMMFKKMYDDGLIYRGFRAINWSVNGQSTCSDDELVYIEREAKLYTFKYSKDFPFTIATTRPETKLGDTAVAVNPKDKRYKKYIGKDFKIDFLGQKLVLKIIGDGGVDIKFGTGALGVTPAHSLVDYEMSQRNNLKIIKVIGEDGKMTAEAGRFAGLSVLEAREKIVEKLKEGGLLEKEEIINQSVGTSDRFGDVVEVLPKTQWFIDVNKNFKFKQSKEHPISGLKDGQEVTLKKLMQWVVKSEQIKIIPDRFYKTYFSWIDNLRDWCISRQIWIGHQIPAWFRGEEIYVGTEPPMGEGWKQDEDTLDTWFSSGMWTFSTLGWPEKTRDLKTFHPTSVLETMFDILFFWVARMIMMSTYALGEIPFSTVYLHARVLDKDGEKMSKSKPETMINPLDVCAKYGTDAVRLSLVLGTSPGNDVKLSEEKIAGFRNFTNKLWNIGRYILTNSEFRMQNSELRFEAKSLSDKWILSRSNALISEVTEDLENFRFSEAGEKLREFTWGDFADWYIEISKIEKNYSLLSNVNCQLLKLWHPFMPYVTEELWKLSGHKPSSAKASAGRDFLMVAEWPKADKKLINKKAEKEFEELRTAIVKMRNLRAEHGIPPAEAVKFEISSKNIKLMEGNLEILQKFARAEITLKNSAGAVAQIKMELGRVNLEKERLRLQSEKENLEKYLAGLKSKLANPDFAARAPKQVVDAEKKKLAEAEEKLQKINEQIRSL